MLNNTGQDITEKILHTHNQMNIVLFDGQKPGKTLNSICIYWNPLLGKAVVPEQSQAAEIHSL